MLYTIKLDSNEKRIIRTILQAKADKFKYHFKLHKQPDDNADADYYETLANKFK